MVILVWYKNQYNISKTTKTYLIWCVDSEFHIKKGKMYKGSEIKSKYIKTKWLIRNNKNEK